MAVTDSKRFIRNAPNRVTFSIVDTNGEVVPGAASLDSEFSTEAGAFADCTNEATEIAISSGIYYLDLITAECTGDQLAYKIGSGSVTRVIVPDPVPALDSGVAQSGTSGSITIRSGASGSNDFYNGALIEIVRGNGAGQVRTIVDYSGSTQLASVRPDWIDSPNSTSVYVIHPRISPSLNTNASDADGADIVVAHSDPRHVNGNSMAAMLIAALYEGGLESGSINDASPTDTSFDGDSGLSSTDDVYNDQLLVMTSGTQAGRARRISDYVASTKTITLRKPLPGAPADTDRFVILGEIS